MYSYTADYLFCSMLTLQRGFYAGMKCWDVPFTNDRGKAYSGVTRGTGPMTPSVGVTPEGKNFCGQIYKELWKKNGVGQVKKVRGDTLQGGDTRMKSIKMTVSSKKVVIFQEKINGRR